MILSMTAEARSSVLDAGIAVIQQETRGLSQLAQSLDERFADAVRLITETTGRVVVAGMGKSGHICRKIAATLSATGSPSFFLHPAEASHGDLGALQQGDTLLMLSNSGSTPELRALVNYALERGMPMIAIASAPRSWLIQAADVGLILPKVAEACPERIAPTTSSTMMLAMGDALAVAAMRSRGVSRDDLVGWHPGGNIGRDAMPVSAVLRQGDPLPLVAAHAGMRDVVIEMTSVGKGVAGVVDGQGDLVGIITDGDLRRAFDRMLTANATEIMTPAPKTVCARTTVAEARKLMTDARITVMFVMDPDWPTRPAAVLHIHDLAMPC